MSDLHYIFTQTAQGLFHMLIFPGGVFALIVGLLLKGIDRKAEARLQRRFGPPLLQPFIDMIKLFGKETMIPVGTRPGIFLAAPVIGLTGMAVCAALLPIPGVTSGLTGLGDMLVYFYLLPLPAVGLIIAASCTGSPYGTLGFSREMTLTFAYEVPLLMVILAVAMKCAPGGGAEFGLGAVVAFQATHGQFGLTVDMIPALLAYLMFLPGALGVPPFDVPEAETEIVEGPLLEYSGPALALFYLTNALKTVILLGLGVVLFFPGTVGDSPLLNTGWFLLKCLLMMLAAVTLVKAATGRFRIEQAFAFYLKYPSALALLSLVWVWVVR